MENQLPRGLSGKESTCQCRRSKRRGCEPWIGKIPCSRKWQPTPVFLPGKLWAIEPDVQHSMGSQGVGNDRMTEHACPIGEQYRDCSKFKNKTTVYLAIPLLGIYLKNTRNNSRKYVHSMLIMALLTVARLWRHHRDLQWDEQSWEAKSLLSTVNRLCHSYSTWPLQCKSSRRHMDTNKHVCQQNLIHYIEIGISYNLHVAQNIFPLLVFVISSPLFIFLLLE